MTDKELRRLSRAALLELLIEQMEENEQLKTELEETKAQLQNKEILIREAGSIAEASLKLNGVFQAAENAAVQYLRNVQKLSGRQLDIGKSIEQQAQRRAEQIIAEAEEYSRRLKARADEYCRTVLSNAKQSEQKK